MSSSRLACGTLEKQKNVEQAFIMHSVKPKMMCSEEIFFNVKCLYYIAFGFLKTPKSSEASR